MRSLTVGITALSLLLSPIAGATAVAAPAVAAPSPARTLHALFDAEWDQTMQDYPTWASDLGDRRYNDRWPDYSLGAYERRQQRLELGLRRLRSIDRKGLPAAEQVNYDLFRRQLEDGVNQLRHGLHLMEFSHLSGLQTTDEFADRLRFTTEKDYRDWLARLHAFPRMTDQTLALLREGMRRQRMQPKLVVRRVLQQVAGHLVEDPARSPYFLPFQAMPATMPQPLRDELAEAGKATIRQALLPALRSYQRFLQEEYLPAAPEGVGLSQLPGGREAYAFLAAQHTTTSLSPEAIHALGLREVARIRSEMTRIKDRIGFQGDLPAFFTHLRQDPRYYYTNADELLSAYRSTAKRIDPRLVRLFGMLPRTPYGVEPIPATQAPHSPTAYYLQPAPDGSRAGTFWVNLHRPETRPTYEMMALALHESVPGHHLQIALAQELPELPNFRKHAYVTAFVEGWGLYAESLGDEMGLYDDPYAKFGQLTYEMWRAVRLVVDTGMHAKGWSRQQAIDYFMANAAKSEHDIVTEVDRYIAMPGQALAYKVGELKIKELRSFATTALGPAFDVRRFHATVLEQGPLPLDVLESRVKAWVSRLAAARPAGR